MKRPYFIKRTVQKLLALFRLNLLKWRGRTNILYGFQDISLIKKLYKEIEDKNSELHFMNREKDRFLSIVSHDLQNGISALKLAFTLIEKTAGSLNNKQLTYLERAERSTNNMYKLLSNFLTINRIQRGIIEPLYNLVNIGNLLEEVINKYTDMSALKDIKLNYENNCKDSFFRTDISFVNIIADNLISNAVKYSPREK